MNPWNVRRKLSNGREGHLKMLAVCSPHDVKDDNGDHLNWVNYIAYETRNALEELQEAYVQPPLVTGCKEQ